MRMSRQRAYRRPPTLSTSSSSWSCSASRRYSWTIHATGTLGAKRNRAESVLITGVRWLVNARRTWLAPGDPALDSQLESTVALRDDSLLAQILQRLACGGVVRNHGFRPHMRTRQTALGVAALQILVDSRQPGLRPETLPAQFLEQVPVGQVPHQVVGPEVAHGRVALDDGQ